VAKFWELGVVWGVAWQGTAKLAWRRAFMTKLEFGPELAPRKTYYPRFLKISLAGLFGEPFCDSANGPLQ
jgi:hypothetical protein